MLPKRKHIRLKNYDYSQNGVYFVTICTHKRRCVLSEITAPVGRGLAPAAIRLTNCGRLVEEELRDLLARYPFIEMEKYVIMPNHVHVLLRLGPGTAGASPRPTLGRVVGAFKSISTRHWNEQTGAIGEKLWQSGYYEHIIRDDNGFLLRWQYIDQNPARWAEDEYFAAQSVGGTF